MKTTGGQPWRLPTGCGLVHLVTAEPDTLSEPERRLVDLLLAEMPAPAVADARHLSLLRRRRSGKVLHGVLAAADGTLLAGSVAELRKKGNAVQAALDTPWSTSPMAGQISRLQMLKRSMYGRAGFDLLEMELWATAGAKSSLKWP